MQSFKASLHLLRSSVQVDLTKEIQRLNQKLTRLEDNMSDVMQRVSPTGTAFDDSNLTRDFSLL